AAAERGSTAEGREGARAKRARRHPGVPRRSYGPRPLGPYGPLSHSADRYIGEEARPGQVPRPEAGGRYRRPNGVRPRGRGKSDPWRLARLQNRSITVTPTPGYEPISVRMRAPSSRSTVRSTSRDGSTLPEAMRSSTAG